MTDLPGAGDVPITLIHADGSEQQLILKPSPAAALTLCRQPGGMFSPQGRPDIISVATRLDSYDIDTMCLIIRLGVGAASNADPKLQDKVFHTGLFQLHGPLSRYLVMLANGGKPLRSAEPEGDAPSLDAGATAQNGTI